MLAASEFEFKQRFWIIGAIFGVAFLSYNLDPQNVLREEAGIAASQGDEYRAYCAKVPRMLPALRPKLPPAGGVPNWRDGLLGEVFMWVLAASVIAFAITLNQTVYFVVLASSFVFYGICLAIISRRRKALSVGAEDTSTDGPAKRGR